MHEPANHLCSCHQVDLKDCPVWVAFDAAMSWVQQGPVKRITNIFGMISTGVLALELRGWVNTAPNTPQVDPLLLKLAEAHRPVVRSHFDAAVPATWRMVSCPACNTGWRTWAPGDVPFRCDIWQELLEKGIVSETDS